MTRLECCHTTFQTFTRLSKHICVGLFNHPRETNINSPLYFTFHLFWTFFPLYNRKLNPYIRLGISIHTLHTFNCFYKWKCVQPTYLLNTSVFCAYLYLSTQKHQLLIHASIPPSNHPSKQLSFHSLGDFFIHLPHGNHIHNKKAIYSTKNTPFHSFKP